MVFKFTNMIQSLTYYQTEKPVDDFMSHAMIKQLNRVAQIIFDKKGFNILVLDVRETCTMTDYFIIAEGNVDRHVKALSLALIDQLAEDNQQVLHVEGQHDSDWVVLDYGDFVIHLFTPEMRERYALEEVWHEGRIVDVQIVTQKVEQKI